MDVRHSEISAFFPEKPLVYVIPKYQREYKWGKQQWEELFNDLIENQNGYFLGSVICINKTTDSFGSQTLEVVDGQQRLTTLSLLMCALYNELKSYLGEQDFDVYKLKYKLIMEKNKDIRLNLQIQNSNRADYQYLLSELGILTRNVSKPSRMGNRLIYKGYLHFLKRIQNVINEEVENSDNEEIDKSNKINKLLEIIQKLNSAILVKIEVNNLADAYTLFASINNRGMKLTSIDFIKNKLLSKLDKESSNNTNNINVDAGSVLWGKLIENIGDDYKEQERFFRHNYNAFRRSFNASLSTPEKQYPIGSRATRGNLMAIYEDLIERMPVHILNELHDNSAIIARITLKNTDGLSPELRDCYQKLKHIQGAPSYLLLMYLVKNKESLHLDDTGIANVCLLLVRFFVRRHLTNTPSTQKLDRLFMSCIEEIEQHQYTGDDIYNNIRHMLIRESASDNDFENELRSDVYTENAGVTRFILCTMAERGMTRETEKDLWEKSGKEEKYIWTIEHIFPEGDNIPGCWVDMIADGNPELAKAYHEQYVHTLGNLTLTAYNSNLSNRAFAEKRDHKDKEGRYIGYRNGFNLNSDVCNEETWTIDKIQARTNRMVQEIMTMFAL